MLKTRFKNKNLAQGEFAVVEDSERLILAHIESGVAGPTAYHWSAKPQVITHGHHVQRDDNFNIFLDVDQDVPLQPVWVRDLSGRVIHTGLGADRKNISEWVAYFDPNVENSADAAINANVPAIVFPRGCTIATSDQLDLIEGTFKTKFRCLEASFSTALLANENDPADILGQTIYAAPNLYPYKLRLDTFYSDGWRLPQVQMLYAKPMRSETSAWQLGSNMLQAWENRPEGETYPHFLRRMGGESWREGLFNGGCTLIPTFEAHNGIAVVGKDFELQDYWPGRAVVGLHLVMESRADRAPLNTILDVVQPGYVTASGIIPAQVIVSDGSGYANAHADEPAAMLPNLDLPHTRCTSEWGACWIPTQPGHFAAPALWGWDILMTGRFLQLSGPLWDPLHYYYASNDLVIHAFDQVGMQNKPIAVPLEMQNRFYPVVPLVGFDTLSEPLQELRKQEKRGIQSSIKLLRQKGTSSFAGYHPLPMEFEFELETFWAPELHPRRRKLFECPEELQDLLCPTVSPAVDGPTYINSVELNGDAHWLKRDAPVAVPSEDVMQNYPHLIRYLFEQATVEDIRVWGDLPTFGPVEDRWLTELAQNLWPGMDNDDDTEAVVYGLHNSIWRMREEGLQLMRLRHGIYEQAPDMYLFFWWHGLPAEDMLNMFLENKKKQLQEQAEEAVRMGLGELNPALAGLDAKPVGQGRVMAPSVIGADTGPERNF